VLIAGICLVFSRKGLLAKSPPLGELEPEPEMA